MTETEKVELPVGTLTTTLRDHKDRLNIIRSTINRANDNNRRLAIQFTRGTLEFTDSEQVIIQIVQHVLHAAQTNDEKAWLSLRNTMHDLMHTTHGVQPAGATG